MTDAFFREQMSRLVGLGFVPGDMTVSRAGRTRVDFPTPLELREDADRAGVSSSPPTVDQMTQLAEPYTLIIPHTSTTVRVTKQWTYCCDHCSDSGWRSWWCGDGEVNTIFHDEQACDRPQPHTGHEWVGPCACVSTNPALARKRDAQRQYAERRAARS